MTSADGSRLPGGTVTFLFLDIEGSTELVQQVGSDYPRLLGAYRTLTERAVSAHEGVVFGSEGDGLFAAFPEAGAAASSAIEAQEAFASEVWPGKAQVRVRMGIHTGSPTLIGDDYTGIDVHRASRIMSAGWGGQVLLSETTESLLAGADVRARELGWFALKGLSRFERLFQLESPGLRPDFPAPRARRREVAVPIRLTSLVGRADDIRTVIDLLRDGARLVTVSGPGGIGKTRIAVAVAEGLDHEYTDGVVFADVSSETDPERMAMVIAESVGATFDFHRGPLESLISHLSQLQMLLVIDGFERFAAEAVEIAELLARCPDLQLLVTSRVSLRIGVEREHRVGPLQVADSGSSLDAIADSPAVRLFMDRARAVQPDLELVQENAVTIRDLVAALDGIPLSIELAAARARLMTPDAILDRLGSALDLGSSSPELPERQRSLRSTIEWSHGLLDEAEQRLLRRLGVFVDGWTIEAAEAVAGDGGGDVILGLENLVAQSLIQVEAEARMTMGTALRQFAAEQLAAAGEDAATRLQHATYFVEVAERSEPLMRGVRLRELVDTLSYDWGNFRSAAEWALQDGRVNLAGRLYTNVWILFWQGEKWSEAEAITRRLAPLLDQLDDPLRARALFLSGGTYMEMGNGEKALTFARPAVELAHRIGDVFTEAWARLIIAGSTVLVDISDPQARDQIGQAMVLARDLGDPFLLSYTLSFQGAVVTLDGDVDTGLALHKECLQLARGLGNKVLVAQALSQIAMTHLASGNRSEARKALEAGEYEVGEVRYREALAVYLDAVAWLSFVEGDPVRAMTALGAANATRSSVGATRWGLLTGLLDAAGIAAESGQPALAEARRAGSEMSPHDAIILAMQPHRELAAAG